MEINDLKAVPYLDLAYITFISEGLIRDVMDYPSYAIPQDTLPADSHVGDQRRSSLRAFTLYFNPSRPITLFLT